MINFLRAAQTFSIGLKSGEYGGRNITRQQEPLNEVMASVICERLGIPYVSYDLTWEEDLPYSICADFVTKQTELVSAWHIMQTRKKGNDVSIYQHYINCCETYSMFGDAEEYITISRNTLLPDKIDVIYEKITSCADEALCYLWEYLWEFKQKESVGNDWVDKIFDDNERFDGKQRSLNALALSVLYQQSVSIFDNKKYPGYRFLRTLAVDLVKKSTVRVASVRRSLIE